MIVKAMRRKEVALYATWHIKRTCIIRIVMKSSLLKTSESFNIKGSIMYSWIQEEDAGDFSTGGHIFIIIFGTWKVHHFENNFERL